MSVWNHILIEGFCVFESASKKQWEMVDLEGKKSEIMKNEHYIPKSKRPKWCVKSNKRRIPQFECLCGEKEQKCPFFAMCDADKEDYLLFSKAWSKTIKR
jgi:hypothetical protein